jgi:hypothetical protein
VVLAKRANSWIRYCKETMIERISRIVVQIHANCVLNNGYEKIYEIPFLRLGGAGETFRQHRPLIFAILEKWMTCKLRN